MMNDLLKIWAKESAKTLMDYETKKLLNDNQKGYLECLNDIIKIIEENEFLYNRFKEQHQNIKSWGK